MRKEEKEVIRISSKEDSRNAGQIASHAIKSMILDRKDVYLKFISEGSKANELTVKTHTVLKIMGRMLKEDLSVICGGPKNIPSDLRDKSITVLTELPISKKDFTSYKIKDRNGDYQKIINEETSEKNVTVIHLILVIEDK